MEKHDVMTDGAPRGAFQLPVTHEFEPKANITGHNTGISLLLSTSVWVLLSPPIEVKRLDQRLKVPVHGRCGERRSHKGKFQPPTRPGIELGSHISYQTVPTSHTRVVYVQS